MLRAIFVYAFLVVFTPVVALPAMLVCLLRPGSDMIMWAGRFWSRVMLWAVGARVECTGLDQVDARIPCVFIANHQSNVDIWLMGSILPDSTRFVAKQSLFRVPALGWAMAAGGFISIDRANRTRAIRSLEVAAERIRAGHSVMLFPEGTRSRDGRLQGFKKGPFHLALKAGVPVVPIAISGSWKIMPPHSLRVRPGPLRVEILPPLELTPFLPADHVGLRNEAHRRLARALGEAATPSPGREA